MAVSDENTCAPHVRRAGRAGRGGIARERAQVEEAQHVRNTKAGTWVHPPAWPEAHLGSGNAEPQALHQGQQVGHGVLGRVGHEPALHSRGPQPLQRRLSAGRGLVALPAAAGASMGWHGERRRGWVHRPLSRGKLGCGSQPLLTTCRVPLRSIRAALIVLLAGAVPPPPSPAIPLPAAAAAAPAVGRFLIAPSRCPAPNRVHRARAGALCARRVQQGFREAARAAPS